jgi:hypothetical protein
MDNYTRNPFPASSILMANRVRAQFEGLLPKLVGRGRMSSLPSSPSQFKDEKGSLGFSLPTY